MRLDPEIVRRQIENLKVSHPEIIEDEESWVLSLNSETDLTAMLRTLERKRQETDALIAGLILQIQALKERCTRFEHRGDGIRMLMFRLMQAAELRKLEMPEATLSIAAGQPRVIITNEPAILADDELCRIKREPNRALIKSLLVAGEQVRGAELSNIEPHLVVRIR